MKKRFLLLTVTVIFAMTTSLFWFSYQSEINKKLDALDRDLMAIQKQP